MVYREPSAVKLRTAIPSTLIGREREFAELRELLGVMSRGMSGALVVRGEVGVGKSALLDTFAHDAGSDRIIRLAGVEPEKHLSFAGLNRLLLPFMGLVDRLPQQQRQAIGSAFGLNQDAPSNPLLLGLSVLTLLAEAAQELPLACVIDDAQWLDIDSLNILAFVARRLHAEQIVMLFAARPLPEALALDGLPEMAIEGLGERDAAHLLVALSSGRIDHQEARRIAKKAGGNLLVLTEVGRSLADGATPNDLLVNDLLPVNQRLEAFYIDHIRRLPEDCRRLLLIAAAISDADAGLLWRTAKRIGIKQEAALGAESIGLIEVHPAFRFRHPMIRSAVYFGASEEDRRFVHMQVAMTIDEDYDPDLKAWHLAAAAVGYDQDVADALEQCANKARERGGYLAEADFLTRSASLSPRRHERASRILAAADAAFKGGAYLRSEELLESGASLFDEPMFRAQALRLNAKLVSPLGRPGDQLVRMLLEAVTIFESVDSKMVGETMLEALDETHFRGRESIGCTPAEVGITTLRLLADIAPDDHAAHLVAKSTAVLYSDGFVTAAPDMRQAVMALADYPKDTRGPPPWSFLGSMLSQALWDDKSNRAWHEYIYEVAQRMGDFQSLLEVLISSTVQAASRGELSAAQSFLTELEQIARAQAGFDPEYLLGMAGCELFAWQGDESAVRATAEMMYAVGEALNAQFHRTLANRALMVLEIGLGKYNDAFSVAAHASETDLIPDDNWSIPVIIEAGVRTEKRQEAFLALQELRVRTTIGDTPWALGILARSEAVYAPDNEAEQHYRDALRLLELARIGSDLARTHLLFGEWLQGQDRTAESRAQLHVALRMFEDMGMGLFANRTRETLSTTGDRIRERAPAPVSDLTPQEAQIARRAAVGETNREIAAAMFISRYTVDYHLRGVFRKLGISSRRELTQVVNVEATLSTRH
jgi:DNA-binding CsgD family transcriptional regulator